MPMAIDDADTILRDARRGDEEDISDTRAGRAHGYIFSYSASHLSHT